MNNRLIYLLLIICLYANSYAQSYIGFGADNFNGIHGILTNPANIADSRLKADINLVSVSTFGVNNYSELNFWNLFTDEEYDFNRDSKTVGLDKKTFGFVNTDVLGPSVMITLNEKHSIGLSTRLRGIVNANNIDGELIDYFNSGLPDAERTIISDVNSSIVANTWVEYGATYARVLKNDPVHFLKAGVTLKYIKGYAYGSAKITDGIVANNPASNDVTTRGEGFYSYSNNLDPNGTGETFNDLDDFEIKSIATGFGVDLGVVYEYRPNHRGNISRDKVKEQIIDRNISTYKFKIGVSLLDIGSVNYTNGTIENYDFTQTVSRADILNGDFNSTLDLFTPTFAAVDQKVLLPTTFRVDFDLRLKDKFYINATTRLSLIAKTNASASRYANQVTVSPRYETRWFTAFSPITVTQYGGVQWGAGARLGPIFIGSSSLFSRVIDDKTRTFDIYAGLKIPIFHKRPKSEEEDGDDLGKRFNCPDCPKDEKQKANRLKGYEGAVN